MPDSLKAIRTLMSFSSYHDIFFLVQAISVPDARYESYRSASDFIREHIFPGGHLPSLHAMTTAAKAGGLTLSSVTDIGPDYAITLRHWRRAWEQRRTEVVALGYPDEFWRKYRSANPSFRPQARLLRTLIITIDWCYALLTSPTYDKHTCCTPASNENVKLDIQPWAIECPAYEPTAGLPPPPPRPPLQSLLLL